MNGSIIEMRSIVKNFGDVQAVRGAGFDLREGEIHSLIGENGAGKSTMMKLLYGMYDRDGGDISIGGESMRRHRSPLYSVHSADPKRGSPTL